MKVGEKNFTVPSEEILSSGHLACPGCGAAIAMQMAMKSLGDKVMIIAPACCWAVCDGPYPYSAAGVPFLHCAFETAAITAGGVKAGLEMQNINDVTVMAWAGDGGTFDIGLQALSGTAERNDDIIYVCYDNEAYMNTGIQRSSATPQYAWTTTTPPNALPKIQPKKNMAEIMAAHRIPYFATATIAFPDDLVAKFKKAKSIKGFRFIHIFSPCPVGWRYEERLSIKLSRLAVHSKVFPLYEIEGGTNYKLNIEPDGVPVTEFLKEQGRFRHLTEKEKMAIQNKVDAEWNILLQRVWAH